jgi:uncharacterized low-complexity protein
MVACFACERHEWVAGGCVKRSSHEGHCGEPTPVAPQQAGHAGVIDLDKMDSVRAGTSTEIRLAVGTYVVDPSDGTER